jgi:hypothetical protein
VPSHTSAPALLTLHFPTLCCLICPALHTLSAQALPSVFGAMHFTALMALLCVTVACSACNAMPACLPTLCFSCFAIRFQPCFELPVQTCIARPALPYLACMLAFLSWTGLFSRACFAHPALSSLCPLSYLSCLSTLMSHIACLPLHCLALHPLSWCIALPCRPYLAFLPCLTSPLPLILPSSLPVIVRLPCVLSLPDFTFALLVCHIQHRKPMLPYSALLVVLCLPFCAQLCFSWPRIDLFLRMVLNAFGEGGAEGWKTR